MANSLEARSPFLDHKVMEFAARLPIDFKLRGTSLKYLLKKVAAPLLPKGLLNRRKMGFGVPVGNWMRNQLRPMIDDVLLSSKAMDRGYFRPDSVRRLVREHSNGIQRPRLAALGLALARAVAPRIPGLILIGTDTNATRRAFDCAADLA